MKKINKKINFTLGDLIPIISFVVIFVFFAVASDGKLMSKFNLSLLLDQSMQVIILGCGMIFVVAQGSIDLSVGVNLALSGVIGSYVAIQTGMPWLIFPVTIIVGIIVGAINGLLLSRCHVPSFMLTLAMLIGVRGIVNYLLTRIGIGNLPAELDFMNESWFKIPAFFIIIGIVAYVFEFTKIGRYSRAIGENETTAKHVGIPVARMKLLVFVIAGLMAGVGALFSMASVGGTTMQMGSFMEMKTCMAIFFGGVLVTGGSTAKFYKIILGSLSITLIVNGLALIGKSETQISESVEGVLLLIVLFITILVNNRKVKADADELPAARSAEAEAKTE